MRPVPHDSTESLGAWLKRNGQTQGAIDRFWRLVIASALNADLDAIALPYAAKVIRELFMNSAEAGSMGMSTVPLSELYAGAAAVPGATRIECSAQRKCRRRQSGTKRLRNGRSSHAPGTLRSDFLVLALPFEATAKLLPHMPPAEGAEALAARLSATSIGPSAACISGSTARLPISITRCCSTARFTGCTTRAVCSRGASEGQLPGTGRQRLARLCGALARAGNCAGGERAGRVFPRRLIGEAGKGCAGQGSARHLWRAAGNR